MTAPATKTRKLTSKSGERYSALLKDDTINANSYGASTLFGTSLKLLTQPLRITLLKAHEDWFVLLRCSPLGLKRPTPQLNGPVTGVAGPIIRAAPNGDRVIVSGHVMLDTPDLLHIVSRPQGLTQVRATIMHELAHVVGLAHVEDPTQLMHATATETTGFAAGDRAALAKLGAGKCHPQL